MSVFTNEEIEYLKSQLLGRLATVGPDGQPHAVAVSFRYNAELDTIDFGGHDFAPEMFRISPRRIVSWGIDGNMVPAGRSVS
jgi:hypothetical protein